VKIVFLTVVGALVACYGGAPPPIPLRPVRFLSFSDLTTADTVTGDRGGLARVSTVRRRLRDQGPVLFVLSGDALSPSPASKFFHGQQMIEALNAAQLNYATFGNHEFDLEGDTLLARVAASNFKWLSSNCTRPNGSAFPKVLPWDTVRVSGHKVGLFGLTLQGPYPSYVRCSNPDSAAHRTIETLSAEGSDLIVGVTHQPTSADRELLGREPKLDLVLGGHEAQAQDSVVSGRHVVKADANATTVEFITLWGGKGSWRQAVGRVPIDATLPRDTLVSVVVSRWKDSLRARLGPRRILGTTQMTIGPADSTVRSRESILGDLVTDAIRAGTGSEVALLNAGALRLDHPIPPGPITNYDLQALLPFADQTPVVTFRLSGARLRSVLERGVSEPLLGTGGFLQVSGISFSFDSTRPSGSRLIGEVKRSDGKVLGKADTVLVALNSYPACQGGDGYQIPEAADSCARVQSAPKALDLLSRYITDSLHGSIAPPKTPRVTVGHNNTNPG
jgi:5'-nucleotidase / UDP-sugar diphosphatase